MSMGGGQWVIYGPGDNTRIQAGVESDYKCPC